eukprot:8915616-Alexandrium_andersonii.AAC.1
MMLRTSTGARKATPPSTGVPLSRGVHACAGAALALMPSRASAARPPSAGASKQPLHRCFEPALVLTKRAKPGRQALAHLSGDASDQRCALSKH